MLGESSGLPITTKLAGMANQARALWKDTDRMDVGAKTVTRWMDLVPAKGLEQHQYSNSSNFPTIIWKS